MEYGEYTLIHFIYIPPLLPHYSKCRPQAIICRLPSDDHPQQQITVTQSIVRSSGLNYRVSTVCSNPKSET